LNHTIRPEILTDTAAIHAVTAAAFLNAPHTDHTERYIVDALRKADALTLSLVAEVDGAIVGHVAASQVSISDGSTGWYGLGPISVIPDRQGQGIGSALMRSALQELRESGAAGCVLLGDPDYYTRFGFEPEAGLVLPDVPPEYFQALAFNSSLPRGVVTYHAAFNAKG
jgi:putative acetyltransferase